MSCNANIFVETIDSNERNDRGEHRLTGVTKLAGSNPA